MAAEPRPPHGLARRILSGILRPKFSLRTLLVVMFVASVAMAWWSQQGRVQHEVCRELTKRQIQWSLVEKAPWYWQWLPKRVLDLGEGHWFRHVATVSYGERKSNQQSNDWEVIARLPKVDQLVISWHGAPTDVAKMREQLSPLSQARGIDGIRLNPYSVVMNDPAPSLSTPLFEALPPMPHLKRLTIYLATLSVEGLRSLDRFPNLIDLDLSYTSVDAAGVVHIARLTQLERLDLSRQRIGDTQLHHLRSLRRIKELHLNDNTITDQGLDDIASLTTLTELGLGDNPITDVSALRPLRLLKRLDLSDTSLVDAGLTVVEAWPHLEQLDLGRSMVTSQVAPHLLAAKNLKHLDLEECNVDDAAVATLLKGLKLETLNIKKTLASPAILAEINRCRTLKEVEIGYLKFSFSDLLQSDPKVKFRGVSDEFRNGLGHFDQVFPGAGGNSLRLFGVTEVAGHLDAIRRNKTITTLSLASTDVTDADLEIVGTLTQLKDLDLRSTNITDAGLAHLAGLVNLERLDLSGTQVTRDGLQHLAALQKLSHLRLTNLDLATGEADRWPVLPAVTQLDISWSRLSADKPLPLSAFPNLTFLECRDTPIPAAALQELSQLPALDYLLLGAVDDPDALVNALDGASKLTKLHFAGDELSAEGFAVLRGLSALDFVSLDLKSLSVEHLRPLAGHPSLRVFISDQASWNQEFLPIVASMPALARFCTQGVDLQKPHLAIMQGPPLTAGAKLEWDGRFGPLPERPDRFAMTSSSIRVTTISLRKVTLNERDLQNIALMVNVKTIQLSGCELPETAGKVLAALPDLNELDMERMRLAPQFLADLKNCRSLTKLRLRNAEITPEIVSHLLELKWLEALDLSNSRISDADVARLLTMPSLSELNLQGTKVTDAAFAQATRAARLSELNVKETAVTHNLVTVLHNHPSLQWFSQDGLSFDPEDCDHYLRGQPMPEARDVNITKGLLAIKPDGGLAESKFLSSLTMTATTHAGELLRIAAKHCAAVETLQLVDEDLSAGDLAEIPPSAQYVYFKNCRFSLDAFSELPRVHVRHVRFIDCPPCDVDLTGLSQLPCLRLVMFEGNSAISSEQVVQLSRCRYLRDVRLGMSQVSDEAIRQLADLPSIRSLGVYPASLSPESRARIKQDKPWLELE